MFLPGLELHRPARQQGPREQSGCRQLVQPREQSRDLGTKQDARFVAHGPEQRRRVGPVQSGGDLVQLTPGVALLLRPHVVVVEDVGGQRHERQRHDQPTVAVADRDDAQTGSGVAAEDHQPEPQATSPHFPDRDVL